MRGSIARSNCSGGIEGRPLTLPSGIWTLEKHQDFAKFKEAISNGQCAETYFLEHPVTLTAGAAVADTVFDEVTPILLSASYLTGMTVTVQRSTMRTTISV
jgi:hypothetical protein